VNSGALTIVASLAVLLTYTFLHTNLLFAGLVQIVCKLYNNALLATLNARAVIKSDGLEGSHYRDMSSYELSFQSEGAQRRQAVPRPIEVFQQVATHVTADDVEQKKVATVEFSV